MARPAEVVRIIITKTIENKLYLQKYRGLASDCCLFQNLEGRLVIDAITCVGFTINPDNQ